MNPGGSVKDRAALYIVKDAEERGEGCNHQSKSFQVLRELGLLGVNFRIHRVVTDTAPISSSLQASSSQAVPSSKDQLVTRLSAWPTSAAQKATTL